MHVGREESGGGGGWAATHVDFHALVQVVAQDEVMGHGEAVRLHRMVVAVVGRADIRIIVITNAVLRRRHDGRSQPPKPARSAVHAAAAPANAPERRSEVSIFYVSTQAVAAVPECRNLFPLRANAVFFASQMWEKMIAAHFSACAHDRYVLGDFLTGYEVMQNVFRDYQFVLYSTN